MFRYFGYDFLYSFALSGGLTLKDNKRLPLTPVHSLDLGINLQHGQNFFSLSHSSFKLSGAFKDGVNSQIIISKKSNPKDRIELYTRISDLFAKEKSISGLCRLKNLEGNLKFQFSPEKLNGQFNFQNQILGRVDIDLKKESYLSSQVKLQDFKVMRALSDSVASDDISSVVSALRVVAGADDQPRRPDY